MHVLITGGTGFIGGALAAALLARGDRVTVLTRDAARAARVLPPGAAPLEELVPAAAPAPDAVVNLAGASLAARRWTAAYRQELVASRVDTTRRLVLWLRTLPQRPKVLVSGSAIGYYGARGDEPLAEDAPPGDEFQARLCRDWEEAACEAEQIGVRVCRIRTGVTLDRGGGALARMLPPFRLGLGGRLGHGRQWFSWIHRDDLVALILWLLDGDGRRGPYNATAPHPATNAELTRTLARVLHRPAVLPVPAPVLRLALGGMAHVLLTGQKVVPARARAEGFPFRYATLERALQVSV